MVDGCFHAVCRAFGVREPHVCIHYIYIRQNDLFDCMCYCYGNFISLVAAGPSRLLKFPLAHRRGSSVWIDHPSFRHVLKNGTRSASLVCFFRERNVQSGFSCIIHFVGDRRVLMSKLPRFGGVRIETLFFSRFTLTVICQGRFLSPACDLFVFLSSFFVSHRWCYVRGILG